MAEVEVATPDIPWLDGEAQRLDAEQFEGIPQVEGGIDEETYVLSHGRLSERVRKTALEVLVHCQPITLL